MFSEEILVRLGIDKRSLSSGLKQSTQDVKDFKTTTVAQLREIHHEMRNLHLLVAGGGLLTVGLSVAKEAFSYIRDAVYSAADEAQKLMEHMDESRKSALELVEAIKKLRVSQLSDNEQLDSEQYDNERLTREDAAAKIRYQQKKQEIADLAERFKNLPRQQEGSASLEKELLDLELKKQKAKDNLEESNKRIADLQKRIIDSGNSELEKEQRKTEEKKRQADAVERAMAAEAKRAFSAYNNEKAARLELATSMDDRTKLSLGDLANMDPRQFRKGSDAREDILDARDVQDFEADAKNIGLNDDYRKWASERALELRKGIKNLRGNERDPMATLEQHAKTTADVLSGFEKTGMPIRDE